MFMSNLIDKYGRRINYLRISVTDRCNLRCIYCISKLHNFRSPDEILDYEEILKVAYVATSCGINKIRITGGEPLIRKNIVYLINALAKMEGINDFSLTTNGTLLSEYLQSLKTAGLKRINISLDSLCRQKYKLITGNDALNKILNGIDKALTLGLNPIKINVVVMKGINDDEIIEFAKLTLTEPLYVRFIELMPLGCEVSFMKERFISNEEVRIRCESLGKLKKIQNISDNGITVSYRFDNSKGVISFISPISEPFCFKCSRLRLTSDGKLKLCLGTNEEINIKPILRNERESVIQLKQIFDLAVKLKPISHHFHLAIQDKYYEFNKITMCQIGG